MTPTQAALGIGFVYMYTEQAVLNWCDACVHAETGSVDPLTNVGQGAATWGKLYFDT